MGIALVAGITVYNRKGRGSIWQSSFLFVQGDYSGQWWRTVLERMCKIVNVSAFSGNDYNNTVPAVGYMANQVILAGKPVNERAKPDALDYSVDLYFCCRSNPHFSPAICCNGAMLHVCCIGLEKRPPRSLVISLSVSLRPHTVSRRSWRAIRVNHRLGICMRGSLSVILSAFVFWRK